MRYSNNQNQSLFPTEQALISFTLIYIWSARRFRMRRGGMCFLRYLMRQLRGGASRYTFARKAV